jgi:hypothetical protein
MPKSLVLRRISDWFVELSRLFNSVLISAEPSVNMNILSPHRPATSSATGRVRVEQIGIETAIPSIRRLPRSGNVIWRIV